VARLRQGSAVLVSWPPQRQRPAAIRGLALPTRGATDEQRVRGFLSTHSALFGDAAALRLHDVQRVGSRRVVRFDQRYRGLPVFGATVAVVLGSHDQVRGFSSELVPLPTTSVEPAIDATAAVRAACKQLGSPPTAGSATLGLSRVGAGARLVYRVALPLTVDPRVRWHLVDAHSGAYLGWRRAAPGR
jgi:Zn-dependent metalloprotease